MAKVPDNFGENVDDIMINADGSINNYKRKIKFLELELEQAEAQRAEFQLKLRKMMGALYSNEHDQRYANLSKDQLEMVDQYAYNLQNNIYEFPVTDKTRELQKEVERLRAQLEVLENHQGISPEQLQTLLGGRLSHQPSEFDGNGLTREELMDILREHREEMENMLKHQTGSKLAGIVGVQPVDPSKTQNGSQMSQLRFPGKYFDGPKPIQSLFGDMINLNEGYSDRFKSRIKVGDLSEDYSGELDLKTAKTYITAL